MLTPATPPAAPAAASVPDAYGRVRTYPLTDADRRLAAARARAAAYASVRTAARARAALRGY